MTAINVLNRKYEKVKELEISLDLGANQINTPVVYQVTKALLAGRRQGTACTKTKGLVRGGGAKPFRQKGTGRARQGSTRSPLNVGGGTAFGPLPRDFSQKVNKKVMNKALQSILADKLQAGKLSVVETFNDSGKTKELAIELKERNISKALIVVDNAEALVVRASRNLRYAQAMPLSGLNIYEMLKYENLIIEESAFNKLVKRLS